MAHGEGTSAMNWRKAPQVRGMWAFLCVALIATACSTRQEIHVSLARAYDSIDQLRKDSAIVLIAAPQSAVTDTLNGVPVTITLASVIEVIDGKLQAESIAIQQFGTSSVASPDTSALLRTGSQYLLFVDRFHLVDGDQTGRFVITGDQGVFELHGDAYVYSGTEYLGVSLKLPRSIGTAEMRDVVTRDSTP